MSKKPTKPKTLFSRGYKECRNNINKNPYYLRSCFNCKYYYQASGDKEEVCQNPNVIEYDMVVNENNVYCLKWELNTKSENTVFKNGRNKLD